MHVEINAFGFIFKIDVDLCDKIKQVKHKIKEAHGLDVDKHELYLGGLKLENEKTVRDYKIEENGVIRLLRIVTGGFQNFLIYIKNIRGKKITLQVRPSYTIEKVKKLIFEKEGIEVDKQRLIFGGNELLNDKLVSSYGIVEGTTLYIVNREHGGSV